MLSINTNLSSLIAQGSMKSSTNRLNQAIERMTTGFKINHAKDNAANYSISTNMTTKLNAYDVAADNCAMGMDLVTTASDTVSLMQDKAERLRALCTQARNGTYGASSLAAINAEANAILAELNRIYSTAEYNGLKLFGSDEASQVASVSTESEGGFISDPIICTDAEVAAMTTMTQAVAESSLVSGGTYSISTVDELVALAEYVNSGNDTTGMTFVLGANIDLSSISNWTPIGDYSTNSSYQFKGVFDGNGHVIKNLNIDNETKSYQGLFGYTASGSEIKNIGLEGGSVKGNDSVGGLVGDSSSSITNCYATGTVSGDDGVGGLVGYSFSSITNCYATGTVSGTSCLGGLVGASFSSITNSYVTGTVSGTSYVGGLVGDTSATVTNSASVQADNYATQMTEEEILSASNLESMGFTEANGWTIVNGIPLLSWQKEAQSGTGAIDGSASFLMQIGINSDSSCQIGFDINFTFDLSAVGADISSDEALNAIDNFIIQLSEHETKLGAVQNRLESALESIMVSIDNLTSSRSTIRDADIAEVSSTYIQQQILQQASATLLATANQSPSIALQLI